MDAWDDDQLGAALRRRSDALAVGDLAAVGEDVRRRGRRRRVTRAVLAGGSAVLLVGAGALVLAGRDDEVVRSPATSPTVVSVPPPTSTVLTTDPTPATTVMTVPSTPAPTVVSVTPAPLPTAAPVVGTSDPAMLPDITELTSRGGTVLIEVDDGVVRLFGAQPSRGYDVEVEDDGPDRVRVRFESGDLRSRITVDLVDGELRPKIVED